MRPYIGLRFVLSLVCVAGALAYLGAGVGQAPSTSISVSVDQLIAQLGDKDFTTRNTADTRLREIGWPAVAALVIAREGMGDEEIKARLSAVIEDIAWNRISVGPEAAQLLKNYREKTGTDRRFAEMELSSNREASIVAARAQFVQTGNAGDLMSIGLREAKSTIRQLVEDPKTKVDEKEWTLLAIVSTSSDEEVTDTLVRLAKKNGRLEQLSKVLECFPKAANAAEHFEDLRLQIAIAAGKIDDVIKAFNGARHERSYIEQELSNRRDWDALAALPLDPADGRTTMVRAAAMQFGNHRDRADALLKFDGKPFDLNVVNVSGHAPLLLNRMDLASQLYALGKDYLDGVSFLLMQRRYAEAFAMVETAKAGHYAQAAAVESQLIVELVRLNELDRAKGMIKTFTTGAYNNINSGWVKEGLNRAELALGDFKSIAARVPTENELLDVLDAFDPRRREAAYWLGVLQKTGGTRGDHLEKALQILDDQVRGEELARIANRPLDFPKGEDPAEYAAIHLIPVYRLKRAGHAVPATFVESFQKVAEATAIPGAPWMFSDLAPDTPIELILTLKDWKFSRPILESLCKPEHADPIFKFLLGVCMERQGEVAAGKKAQEESDATLGTNLSSRVYLARLLYRCGELDLAKAQARAVVDMDRPHNQPRYLALLVLADVALERGDFEEALQDLRLYSLDRIYYMQMPEDQHVYIRVPRLSAYCEARVAIGKGDAAGAFEAARGVPKLDPEDLDATLQLIDAFKKAHMDDQAKSLAAVNRELLESILKDFPNSHLHHFLIAKLDRRSGFETNQTMAHLEKARQLAPGNKEYQAFK